MARRIEVRRGDTLSIAITGIGNIAARSSLWFTVKRYSKDADSESLLQIDLDGLSVLAGSSSVTTANGSITVDDETTGNITIALAAAESASLSGGEHLFDVQMRDTSGTVTTMATGRFSCNADITDATS